MSAKWRRSKRWDDEHFPRWAWPAKALLRALSSITLAVALLSLVAVYAVLASVPIGLLARVPTYLVYGVTLIVTVGLATAIPVEAWRRATRGVSWRAGRFAIGVLGGCAAAVAGAWAWWALVWPALRHDPVSGGGLMLFAEFCRAHQSTTLRRLPGMEMSELEFYSWWPLRAILLTFVVNLVVATARRIEFRFVNLGVLTVHTGIVLMALGSVYYGRLKQEGDVLLLGGEVDGRGRPTPGRPETGFYDGLRTVLHMRLTDASGVPGDREQWALRGVPRYNSYGVGTLPGASVRAIVGARVEDDGRALDIPVRPMHRTSIPEDVTIRVVGYVPYAEPLRDWVEAPAPAGGATSPARFMELHAAFPGERTRAGAAFRFFFLPAVPSARVSATDEFAIEWTRGMADARWSDLVADVPGGGAHALVVEVGARDDGEATRVVRMVRAGDSIEAAGWVVDVAEVLPAPPLEIVTDGYRGATSSVAIVRLTPPGGGAPIERWVYHRFPEIAQDLLARDGGMPERRAPDPRIRVGYVDLTRVQVYVDERGDGTARVCVRQPGAATARVIDRVAIEGGVIDEFVPRRNVATDPKIDLALAGGMEHVEAFERPMSVPERERDASLVGTHDRAMLGVEVRAVDGFRRVVWLPFTKYLVMSGRTERRVELPDGRSLALAFGRAWRPFPTFALQLLDFEMVAYEHRGAPRDYRSLVRVVPTTGEFERYEHVVSLNEPLQAPFMWSEGGRAWMANVAGTITSRLSWRQFKLSQAGWDAEGWRQTQAMADRGEIPRPVAQFTILAVGNNPGIHVIALGAVLVALGTPWAFYVKPWLLRRASVVRRREVSRAAGEPVGAGA